MGMDNGSKIFSSRERSQENAKVFNQWKLLLQPSKQRLLVVHRPLHQACLCPGSIRFSMKCALFLQHLLQVPEFSQYNVVDMPKLYRTLFAYKRYRERQPLVHKPVSNHLFL